MYYGASPLTPPTKSDEERLLSAISARLQQQRFYNESTRNGDFTFSVLSSRFLMRHCARKRAIQYAPRAPAKTGSPAFAGNDVRVLHDIRVLNGVRVLDGVR